LAGHLLRRLLGTLGVLFGMSILIFAAVHILPGNVAYAILGEYATPAAVAQLEQKLGLHDPLWLQYWRWLRDMLHGDFGESVSMSRPAWPVIADALGRSALLAGISFVLVAALGIALGVHAATHRGQASDRVATLMQLVFIAIPDFFWGVLCVVVFAAWLHWLPAAGYMSLAEGGFLGWSSHLLLPVLVLSLGSVAHVSRLTRSSKIEVLGSRYVLAARARGFAGSRVLLPAITILAVDLGILIGGVVVIETVFAYPGLGRMLVFAIEQHDLPLLQAGMMVLTAIYALANLIADLLYAVLNPRIRVAAAA
jgi:peptide/nickel transport system permease protein